jgi:early secretory antigenic target protein ESAT-6
MAEAITVDMEKLHAVTAGLRKGATDCQSTNGEIAGELQTLRSYMVQAESFWQGTAGGAFQELMTQFDGLAKQLNEALQGISTTLNQNADAYDSTEQTNTTGINNIINSLPPIRL